MALAPVALGLAGASLTVAAVDRLSKRLASPGVANDGLPEVQGGGNSPAASSPASTERRLLVVIGASGGTGAAVVEAALAKDFRVRAVLRSTARLRDALGELMDHPHLEVVVADLAEASLIFDAVVGATAVLCTAGANPETAPGPVAAAMPNIVAACRKAGVLRLVVQACALASVPGEWWGLLTPGRLTRAVVRWQLSSNTVDDGERVMRYLYQQVRDVPWVVARPVWLEEGERRAALVPNLDAFQASCIRYADLADWLLDQVDSDAYVGKMPRLQYGPVQCPI